jgi:hypothetical protein
MPVTSFTEAAARTANAIDHAIAKEIRLLRERFDDQLSVRDQEIADLRERVSVLEMANHHQ